jgi:DNA ligase-associated metallophosphoesterase
MKIMFAGREFLLHPSGVLFWPDEKLAIVSDLHLEKGSHFARRGFFLPPYDSHETLVRLHKTLESLRAEELIVLGDGFHDAKGYDRLSERDRFLFNGLKELNPVWIKGNHDSDFVPEGFLTCDFIERGPLTFIHEATKNTPYEISGHYHPKADIFHKGAVISRRCFIEDGNKMILPSFGSYTGGLSVSHSSIARNFAKKFRVYALGDNKVFLFTQASGIEKTDQG